MSSEHGKRNASGIKPLAEAGAICRLARKLEAEGNAAFDLWSWLPSEKLATELFGDYSFEVASSPEETMREACRWISILQDALKEAAPGVYSECMQKQIDKLRKDGWFADDLAEREVSDD